MQKVIKILIVFVICGGCAALKKGTDVKSSYPERNIGLSFYEKVVMHNLSNKSFYISRANIVLERNGNSLSGFANIKFKYPDTYLLSIRSIGGFEVLRAFITGDTLLVNDRINRKLLYGKPDYLKKLLGIGPYEIPLIFGDFYSDSNPGKLTDDCINGLTKSYSNIGKYKGVYTLNCAKEKVINTVIEYVKGSSYLVFGYNDFQESGNLIFPKNISVEHKGEEIRISIEIKSIEYPWEGEIEFIPGGNYERVELL